MHGHMNVKKKTGHVLITFYVVPVELRAELFRNTIHLFIYYILYVMHPVSFEIQNQHEYSLRKNCSRDGVWIQLQGSGHLVTWVQLQWLQPVT